MPGMRSSSQSRCTRLSEMPHSFAASGQDIYSIFIHPFSKPISIIIYGKPYNSNAEIMNYLGYYKELYKHIRKKR